MKKCKVGSSRTYATSAQRARADEDEPNHSAAARALAILRAVSASETPVSAVELHPRLGLPKPTIHRLMLLLENLGFLEREPGSKRFITGPAQAEMALETFINSPQRTIRHAILQSLVDDVQETCNITVLSGSEVIYVDRVESHWPLRSHMQPGSRVPLHCGASGKLFLSFMPAQKRRQLLHAAPLQKYTENTVIDATLIEKELKRVRTAETGLDAEEFLKGLIGVAVPVFDARKRMCATVSLHVPTVRCTPEQAIAYVPALKRAAIAVGRTLGAKA